MVGPGSPLADAAAVCAGSQRCRHHHAAECRRSLPQHRQGRDGALPGLDWCAFALYSWPVSSLMQGAEQACVFRCTSSSCCLSELAASRGAGRGAFLRQAALCLPCKASLLSKPVHSAQVMPELISFTQKGCSVPWWEKRLALLVTGHLWAFTLPSPEQARCILPQCELKRSALAPACTIASEHRSHDSFLKAGTAGAS